VSGEYVRKTREEAYPRKKAEKNCVGGKYYQNERKVRKSIQYTKYRSYELKRDNKCLYQNYVVSIADD